jgi:predicted transposase YbfD/YdcC
MHGFKHCFADLKDPRATLSRRHDLQEVLTIALCAVLCGGETAVDMAAFAEAKQEFLGRFLKLKNGLPSHDTFSRVFRRLDPDQFRDCFQKFLAHFGERCSGVIAIDGKVVRRSMSRGNARSALMMISAWCCDKRMVLAQVAAPAKTHEAAGVVRVLEMLSLEGSIVTADALNCQRNIAQQIISQNGNYVLALKGNHGALHAAVRHLFDALGDDPGAGHSTVDSNHGRVENRTSLVSTDIDVLQKHFQWPGLAAVGRVVRTRRTMAGATARTTTETAHYLLSTPLSAERLGQTVRSHWGVENRLHWVLNVVMNEDQGRSRLDNSPYNLAILRHMALNLMQKDRSNASLRLKFNRAAWQDDFLAGLIAGV